MGDSAGMGEPVETIVVMGVVMVVVPGGDSVGVVVRGVAAVVQEDEGLRVFTIGSIPLLD